MRSFGEDVRRVILNQYDNTRSPRNKRRTNKFRDRITTQGPFVSNDGTITVTVGAKLPSFWPILEFGVSPHKREQTFQIVGRIPSKAKDGLRPFLDSGKRLPSKSLRKDSFRRSQIAAVRRKNFGTTSPGKLRKSDQGGFVKSQFDSNFVNLTDALKLVPRTKAELSRIKRKVTIEFIHPGFTAGGFIRAGVRFIRDRGDEAFARGFQKTLDEIKKRTNALAAKNAGK